MLDQPAPDFELPATGNTTLRLRNARGKTVVLYFSPKDNTPGCTAQGQQFRDLHPQFRKLCCEVYGVSRDSLGAHEDFKARMNLPFQLLSDSEEVACKLFDVIKMKNMYGKKVRDRAQHFRRRCTGRRAPGMARRQGSRPRPGGPGIRENALAPRPAVTASYPTDQGAP